MAKCSCCGKGGLFQKLNKDKLCLFCVTNKYERLIEETPKEAYDLAGIKEKLERAKKESEDLSSQIEKKEKELEKLQKQFDVVVETVDLEMKKKSLIESIKEKEKELKQIQKKMLVAQEELELEDFALYRPKFAFANSTDFKAALDCNREMQKQEIKNKQYFQCDTQWTVDGSVSKGRQFAEGIAKMEIRAFNAECDNAIAAVKFSNYQRCEDRIRKAYDVINNANKTNKVYIRPRYLELKITELELAYEYQCKKEEEKERLRELREQQREEAKLQKEIEAARKEAEKEKKHYQQALEKLRAQAEKAVTDEQKQEIAEKQEEILGFLDDLQKKMEDIDYRQNNQRAGYVYVISNIGSFGEGVYKIGMTRRLTPMERVDELGDASVPFRFDVHAMIFSEDAPKLEAALHRAFEEKRVNKINTRREYFRVSLDEIKEVVKNNHDKTVEFVDHPDAWQYRESLQIK